MNTRFGSRIALVLVTLAIACGQEDKTPPAPPLLSPVRSPTSLDKQTLHGTAEFGSTVTVTGASSVEPAVIKADPYTAQWEATVSLAVGKNELSVTAKDAAGNVSQATTATIVREPIHAKSLSVRLSRSFLTADEASLVVHVSAVSDEPVSLAGLQFQVAVAGYGKPITSVMVTSDANGMADATIAGLSLPGMGTIEVTAPASTGLKATADFLVKTGQPAAVTLGITDCSGAAPASSLTIPVGTDVCATVTVKDQPQNVITDASVALFTNAPNAFVEGGRIKDIKKAGSYRVVAMVSGTLLSSEAMLTVTPGAAALVSITPTPLAVRAGVATTFTVSVTDGFGNPISSSFTLSTNAPSGSTTFTAPATYSFCSPGAWTVTAQAGTGGPMATAAVTVTPGAPVGVSIATTPSPATVAAGQKVSFTTTTADSCGNPTADVVQVSTNAPGALVSGGMITGLTRAGSWTIVAQVAGTTVSASKPLLVNADASTTVVSLTLTAHAAFVGVPIGYSVTAVDGFGNPVSGTPTITVSPDTTATVNTTVQSITFTSTGTQTITAALNGASDSDFAVVTRPDTVSPTVSITAPAAGTVFAPGATVTVTVNASDDIALAEVSLQASGQATFFQTQLAPGGTASSTFTFSVPLPGGARFGTISFIAQAVDTSSNRTSTPILTINVDPAAGIVLVGGFAATTLSGGNLLNAPAGLAIRTGTVYVSNFGTKQILSINSANGAQTAFTPTQTNRPVDLTYVGGATDSFFATMNVANQILKISSSGAATVFTSGGGNRQKGILFDGTNLWTVSDDDFVRRYAPTSGTPTCQIDMSGTGSFPGLGGGGWGLAFQADGSLVVTEDNRDRVWRITAAQVAGGCSGVPPVATQIAGGGDVNTPRDIILSSTGKLYYVNSGDGRLMRIDPAAGNATTTIASGMNNPVGLAFDASGALLVSDVATDTVFKFTGPF